MKHRMGMAMLAAICVGAEARAALVDIIYSPTPQTVEIGELFEIQLNVSSQGPGPQPFAAVDALIGYDQTKLQLVGYDKNDAGAGFFVQGFLPDPDGINLNIGDGLALFTALAPPGNPVPAPVTPSMLVVTSLKFIALEQTPATNVILVPSSGAFGQTRVLIGPSNVTGNISSIAVITVLPSALGACCLGSCGCEVNTEEDCNKRGGSWMGVGASCALSGGVPTACVSCPGDVTLNGIVDVDDLLTIVNSWGPPTGTCNADITQNGVVDVDDLLVVINQWGPCPP
jgi:hypothetical protein